ncbi:hypothetical protein GJU40_19095 [Bacillus lacus]|uniref:Uncharacterized protein n=1 Tax=Metabacillus lacus TaxID=1983721 RepID=A0A7X2J311_9BACI|nr:hypothetical protein [Metabacillus lacus]MRX74232.1 hypothetical protein [Metabacillus lacus]
MSSEFNRVKEHLDKAIYKDITISHHERRNILNKTVGIKSKKPFIRLRQLQRLIAVLSTVLVFGLSIILLLNDQAGTPGQPIKPIKHHATILKDLEFIKNYFQVGMSEEELIKMIGSNRFEVIPNESGEVEYFIKVSKYAGETIHSYNNSTKATFDTELVSRGNVDLQLIFGMNQDKKALQVEAFYIDKGTMMHHFQSADTEYTEPYEMNSLSKGN